MMDLIPALYVRKFITDSKQRVTQNGIQMKGYGVPGLSVVQQIMIISKEGNSYDKNANAAGIACPTPLYRATPRGVNSPVSLRKAIRAHSDDRISRKCTW